MLMEVGVGQVFCYGRGGSSLGKLAPTARVEAGQRTLHRCARSILTVEKAETQRVQRILVAARRGISQKTHGDTDEGADGSAEGAAGARGRKSCWIVRARGIAGTLLGQVALLRQAGPGIEWPR